MCYNPIRVELYPNTYFNAITKRYKLINNKPKDFPNPVDICYNDSRITHLKGKMKMIYKLCRHFRTQVMLMTITEMIKGTGIKLTTIDAFEHGRSTNINHLDLYLANMSESQKELFFKTLHEMYNG